VKVGGKIVNSLALAVLKVYGLIVFLSSRAIFFILAVWGLPGAILGGTGFLIVATGFFLPGLLEPGPRT